MPKRKRSGPTAERFVAVTVDLIAEQGGSQSVNLREVSRRVGCAHTNVYNYFDSFDDLLWEAFRRTLVRYSDAIVAGLDDALPPREYFRRLVTNLASFPLENPGLYRFIGSDPIDVEAIPEDVLATVTRVKTWLFAAFTALVGPGRDAEDFCNITYGYIDGETFNVINGRVVPGEDIAGRIVANALRLYELFAANGDGTTPGEKRRYPTLTLQDLAAAEGRTT